MFVESNLYSAQLPTPSGYSAYGGTLSVMGSNFAGTFGGHLLAPEKLIQGWLSESNIVKITFGEGSATRGPFYLQPADLLQATDNNWLNTHSSYPKDARPGCKGTGCADWVDADAPIALAIETGACNHVNTEYCGTHDKYKV